MTILRLFAIGFIFICTAFAWAALGTALVVRSEQAHYQLGPAVEGGWGTPLRQSHPEVWYRSPTGERGQRVIQPEGGRVTVHLESEPKQKGLVWYRTYAAKFVADYRVKNPTPIPQTLYAAFALPESGGSFSDVSFQFGNGEPTEAAPVEGVLTDAVIVPPGGEVPLRVSYRTRGLDDWRYDFGEAERIRNFELEMTTDFSEIDFPVGTGSPSERESVGDGWKLEWNYPDVVNPQPIGMAMPGVLNAGPVAARISFFAPVSLLYFFAVLLIFGVMRGVSLHPMNYFFLAAGCFAFQLLFAYLVDVMPVHGAFALAAGVSLGLVTGYVHAVAGWRLSRVCGVAQFAY
ncbi:MAG: hypothetical protein WA771_03745, partial [Chthoniobacterales bacterium]